ncbi:MAG: Transcriptional regulator [Planctomycetaceae bacterium]|nr:Transcriptional regulator [Planctomycetaceae bacterium]
MLQYSSRRFDKFSSKTVRSHDSGIALLKPRTKTAVFTDNERYNFDMNEIASKQVNSVDRLAERLKYARISMKLTLVDVESQTSVGSSTLSEFENGKREPRLPQLKELADLYRRSTSFFMSDEPLPVEIVLWRQKPSSPQVEEIQAQLLRLIEQYHRLEQWCDSFEQVNLPSVSGDPARFTYQQAEKLAHDFRNSNGLGERPGQSLLRVLEEVSKIKVFHMPFEPSGSAACTFHEQFGGAILLNSQNVRWRRNFDLAHELFHLLTWKVFRRAGEPTFGESSPHEEKLATCFARHLLMPQETIQIAIGMQVGERTKLSFEDLFEIARQFDVSIEALLWQMSFVYRLSKQWVLENTEKLRDRISFWDKRQHDVPPVRPLRFEALANEALRRGMISTGKYAEYVGITRREAMRQIEQEAHDDAEVEIAHP